MSQLADSTHFCHNTRCACGLPACLRACSPAALLHTGLPGWLTSSVYLLSLTEGTLVEPAVSFAGRSAAGHSGSGSGGSFSSSSSTSFNAHSAGSSTGSSGSVIMRPKVIDLTPGAAAAGGAAVAAAAAAAAADGGSDGSSGGNRAANRSVAWWGPSVLAVAASDGSVSLVRLPGSVNILGAAPARFAPGVCSCGVSVPVLRVRLLHVWFWLMGKGMWMGKGARGEAAPPLASTVLSVIRMLPCSCRQC